jgi:hypothetical protein
VKNHIYLLFLVLFLSLTTVRADDLAPTDLADNNVDALSDEDINETENVAELVDSAPTDLAETTDWYVDAGNGDDTKGTGSLEAPFKSIHALLSVNKKSSGVVGKGDVVHLAAGIYDEQLVIDIPGLRIEGVSNDHDIPESLLGEVTITANEVTLANCLFLNAGLTLENVEGVSISNNLFSGTVENSLVLLGSSNNSISENRFESATESCVVINCSSKGKQPSNDNVFKENYFTHHPEHTTSQMVLVNKASYFERLFGKRCMSARNRFIRCAFEETISGQLEHVVMDHSSWRIVAENGYSLRFEDCYFKKADRNTPFISFIIIGEQPDLQWYWDELVGDTWFSSNEDGALTGNKKSQFVPFIQFADWDEDGLILETKTPADFKSAIDTNLVKETVLSLRNNSAPQVVNVIDDISVYENAPPNAINLFDVFEDDATADENLKFIVSVDDPNLVSSEIKEGRLILNYAEDATGTALVTLVAIDDDSANPQSTESSFYVVINEDKKEATPDGSNWYIDCNNGDDVKGLGSKSSPFKSINRALLLYAQQPDLNGDEGIIHLSKGNYDEDLLEINVPGISIKGTLDRHGRPLTILGETRIVANGVKLMNCEIRNASLTLLNVENVLVLNNVFSGTVDISLYLLGASKNKIEHNEFSSAIHDCVHLYWDPDSGRSSNENIFLRNYFTHRLDDITRRVIRVNWSTGNNNSISARNRFVECAFKETENGLLLRIIDDDTNWWMVVDHQYSVLFEDCYIKRANRSNPFSEFVILKRYPDFKWRWDELINDEWVSSNVSLALTGDHNGWNHKPRIMFVDKNGNGKALERAYEAGLLPPGKNN